MNFMTCFYLLPNFSLMPIRFIIPVMYLLIYFICASTYYLEVHTIFSGTYSNKDWLCTCHVKIGLIIKVTQ